MIGLGTMVNAAAVIVGGILGLIFKGGLKQRFQDILVHAMGLSVVFIGISGVLQQIFVVDASKIGSKNVMMLVICLVTGSVLGELINIQKHTETLGEWLKKKFGGRDDGSFVEGFVTASFTICIGAMAVVGSLQDGLTGDCSTLFTKAFLDGVIVIIFASVFGKGAIFAVIPLIVFQGSITLLAKLIYPFVTDVMIGNISLVGSALIFCIGSNMFFKTDVKVANLLPSLIVAVVYGLF